MTETVFLLWYVRNKDEHEKEFLIGVYSTEDRARTAICRLGTKPGFVDNPNGFEICPYQLNIDHWTEGFVFAAE